jgi:Arc/MetJ-type ribon-helix-helix transcriptional regulator
MSPYGPLEKRGRMGYKSGMEKEFTSVSIPTSLFKKLEEHIKGTEFRSVASYAAKVLRESLSKAEPAAEVFSKDEEEKVKERLKALGYID